MSEGQLSGGCAALCHTGCCRPAADKHGLDHPTDCGCSNVCPQSPIAARNLRNFMKDIGDMRALRMQHVLLFCSNSNMQEVVAKPDSWISSTSLLSYKQSNLQIACMPRLRSSEVVQVEYARHRVACILDRGSRPIKAQKQGVSLLTVRSCPIRIGNRIDSVCGVTWRPDALVIVSQICHQRQSATSWQWHLQTRLQLRQY